METLFNFTNKEFSLITAGEMIMRLSPTNNELLVQGNSLIKQMGGSEFNVASLTALLGESVAMLTKIPYNTIGEFAHKSILTNKLSDKYIIFDRSLEKRMAIYYYEYGANPRKPRVTYDRLNSSFQNLKLEEIPIEIFSSTKIFHTSGITLGLSKSINNLTKELIKKFKSQGTKISFDVNFRQNLWEENVAREEIEKILPYIDILFASEETFRKMFKQKGEIEEIIEKFSKTYDIKIISSTRREVKSPSSHNFSSIIYEKENNKFYREKAYQNIQVIDRIGSGDAYVAGVLYGILKENDIEKALKYGNASAALKNTIVGDNACINISMLEEIINEHENGCNCEMTR